MKKYKHIKLLSFKQNNNEILVDNEDFNENKIKLREFKCEVKEDFLKKLHEDISEISNNRVLI